MSVSVNVNAVHLQPEAVDDLAHARALDPLVQPLLVLLDEFAAHLALAHLRGMRLCREQRVKGSTWEGMHV